MAIPVVIGATSFRTKLAAKSFIQTDVIKAFDGSPRIPAGAIHDFVDDLLNLHDDAVEKIGTGVDYFRVDPASAWKKGVPVKATNRTLVVIRSDGTEIDWSWDVIVTSPSIVAQKRTALRNAVYDRIQSIKVAALSAGPIICARSGLPILNPDDAQVRHHRPSFAELTDGFAATVGGWSASPSIAAAWVAHYDAHVIPTVELKP
jgi:hypothetical protein